MPFFATTSGKIVYTFLISMVPIVELRAAIPIGYANGLDIYTATAVAVIGNLLPVPFIILFIRKIFAFLRRKIPKLNAFISRLERRAESKSDVVLRSAFWGLFLLVAIPLPGTGAWTGALIAAMLDMRLKKAMPAIFFGVLAAGVVVALATCGVIKLLF